MSKSNPQPTLEIVIVIADTEVCHILDGNRETERRGKGIDFCGNWMTKLWTDIRPGVRVLISRCPWALTVVKAIATGVLEPQFRCLLSRR